MHVNGMGHERSYNYPSIITQNMSRKCLVKESDATIFIESLVEIVGIILEEVRTVDMECSNKYPA